MFLMISSLKNKCYCEHSYRRRVLVFFFRIVHCFVNVSSLIRNFSFIRVSDSSVMYWIFILLIEGKKKGVVCSVIYLNPGF